MRRDAAAGGVPDFLETPLMANRIVRTDEAPAPVAGAPYSQAVAAVPGEVVWVSGQVPVDPATGALGADDVAGQTRLCLRHVAAVLAAAGAGMGDVVKTTVYLTDLAGDFAPMNSAYAEAFAATAPARATVGVAALPLGARVEIEAVAVVAR
jgi:2-iminobutanoate/2-iminopropanoate deaminase